MSFFSSIPIWGWVDIFSNFAVLVALCGESHWALKYLIPNKSVGKTSVKWRREKLKKKFEFLLIIGIAGEVGCLPFSLYESASANKEAGIAKLDAANSLSNSVVLSMQVAMLTSNNLVLEAQLNPRVLEISQPAERLKQYAGIEARIVCGQCSDCGRVAQQIAEILHDANWRVDGSFETIQPVPDGVSIGLCSTNENWDELYGLHEEEDGMDMPKKHRSGLTPEDFKKLQNASDALAEELNNGNVVASRDIFMNRKSNLRFQGVFVLIGPRPSPSEIAANNAISEYERSYTNFVPNPSLSPQESQKQFFEVLSNQFDAMNKGQMRAFGTTSLAGKWIVPEGKYP